MDLLTASVITLGMLLAWFTAMAWIQRKYPSMSDRVKDERRAFPERQVKPEDYRAQFGPLE